MLLLPQGRQSKRSFCITLEHARAATGRMHADQGAWSSEMWLQANVRVAAQHQDATSNCVRRAWENMVVMQCCICYLGLHSRVFYECPSICCEAAHSHPNVCVHLCNLLNARWFLCTRNLGITPARYCQTSALELSLRSASRLQEGHRYGLSHTSNGDVTRFSTTSTTPSFDLTPIAVVPSCKIM